MDSVMKKKDLNLNMSDWKLTRLGDLAGEVSVRVDNPSESGYDRFVGLGNFVSGDTKIKSWETTENLASAAKAFQAGDILFARRNAYLRRASLVDFEGCCSGDAFVLRENHDRIVPGFLAFIVNSDGLWEYANSNAAGTMSKRVKWRDLANYQFLLPPKAQQTRLAELLWAMDEVVEKERRVLGRLEITLKTFREKRVAEDSLPIHKLEQVLIGITAGRSLNGVNTPVNDYQKGVLKVSAVGPDGFQPEENKVLTDQEAFLEQYIVNQGDILITRANTTALVGRVCQVPQDYPNLMLSDKTLRLELNQMANPTFIVEVLKSKKARRQIEALATGTGGAMKNISQSEIRALKIPLPEIGIQDKLAHEIAQIRGNYKVTLDKLTASHALQKSLINQIF